MKLKLNTVVVVTLLITVIVNNSLFSQPSVCKISQLEQEAKFSDFFRSIKYIPLETTDECFLSYPIQLEFDDSLIFVQDHKNDEVFIFSFSGEFMCKLGELGKGPGELLSYGDFLLDKKNNVVEVLDNGRDKLLIFNYSGDYIGEKDLIWGSSIAKNNKDYLVYSGYSPHFHDENLRPLESPVVSVSDEGKVMEKFKKEFKPFGLGTRALMSKQAISKIGDTLVFCPNRSPVIYQYYDKRLEPRIRFDFGDKELPSKLIKKSGGFSFNQFLELQKRYVYEIDNYLETDHFRLFKFAHNGLYVSFTRKKDNSNTTVLSKGFINDIDGIQYKYFHVMNTHENDFYCYIQAYDFRKQVRVLLESNSPEGKRDYKKNNPELLNLYDSLSDSDNPILIKLSAKTIHD